MARRAIGGRYYAPLSESVPPKSRPFPVPLGIIRDGAAEYDCVIAADFSVDGAALEATLKMLSKSYTRYGKICLLHWPDYNGWLDGPIAEQIRCLNSATSSRLHFAHSGLTLRAPKVVVMDEQLVRTPPSDTVRLIGLERVENGQGELCQHQHELLHYFQNGGISS